MTLDAIARFQQLYQQLDRDNCKPQLLAQLYDEHIEFRDPFHRIYGLQDLNRYFSSMYENVEHIEFDFGMAWRQQEHAFIRWQMNYCHPKINSGKPVLVDGGSELIWKDEKIIFHRDFFDGGQMLYEHLPLMGWAIRKLKERMA